MADIPDKLAYRLLGVERETLLNIMLAAMARGMQGDLSIEECIMRQIGDKTKEQLNKEFAL